MLGLPGTYSLNPRSPDERVTCDVLYGRATGEQRPDLVVALNMADLAAHLLCSSSSNAPRFRSSIRG